MSLSDDGSPQVNETKSRTILNDFHSNRCRATEALIEYPKFASLPLELSLAIWKFVLQQHRFISITVREKSYDSSVPHIPPRLQYTAKNELGNTISGRDFQLTFNTNHRLSSLLHVSHESRQATLEFYRVHIPYGFDSQGDQKVLYFNPEFDFLHIRPLDAAEDFVDLVHDFKAYDPLGLGILNMVFGNCCPYDLSLPMSMCPLDPEKFVRILMWLHYHRSSPFSTSGTFILQNNAHEPTESIFPPIRDERSPAYVVVHRFVRSTPQPLVPVVFTNGGLRPF